MAQTIMAYTFMAYLVMACVVMVYIVVACIVIAYAVMVCIAAGMAHVLMAYTVMAYAGMAYIVMACTPGAVGDHRSRRAPPDAGTPLCIGLTTHDTPELYRAMTRKAITIWVITALMRTRTPAWPFAAAPFGRLVRP